MVFLSLDSPSCVFALLQLEGVVDEFNNNFHHRFYLNYYTLNHLLCCIWVPFVTLPILYQQILTTVHYLRLIYRLLQHQVGTTFYILCLWFFYLFLCLVYYEFICPEVTRQLGLNEGFGLYRKDLYFLSKGNYQLIKFLINIFDDTLLCHFFFNKYLLQLIHLVVRMNFSQIGQLIYKLSRMDVQMLSSTFLTNKTFGTFGVDTHIFTYLLMHLALGVDKVTSHIFNY